MLVFLSLSYIQIHQKHYADLSEGVVSLYGNGFKTTNQKEYLSKEEKFSEFTIDETHRLKLDKITFGFRLLGCY